MRYTLPILAAFSLAACSSETPTADQVPAEPLAAETAGPEVAPNDMPTDGAGYVQMAGASDLYEIQSSELALEKSQNENVRQFAEMMIADHRMTTEQITTAASEAGLNPAPPQLTPMQQDLMSQLQAASADQFDQTYIQQQRQAHEMALALHQNFAQNGDAAPLQQVATDAVPVIEKHIDQLSSMDVG